MLWREVAQFVEEVDGQAAVGMQRLDLLASNLGLSRRDAELGVLELGVAPRRYLRNLGTVGLEGQRTLLLSSVAVVGCGGLGGYVVEGLARMGVGCLHLLDGDAFCDHNLNRQLLSTEGGLGCSKVEAARKRVQQINRAVDVNVYPFNAARENLGSVLSHVDVLVDAVDRLPTRLMLQDVAAAAGVPLVHGAIAGWMGQVMTVLPGDPGLRALYGDGPVPEQGAEAQLGSPSASPMMVAAWQVHETVKILLGQGELLRGRVLFMDAGSGDVRVLSVG